MTISNITNANLKLALSQAGANGEQAVPGSAYSDIALQVAGLQAQTLGSLMNSSLTTEQASDAGSLNALLTSLQAAPTAAGTLRGLSPTGRNSALFAPEPAYQMMTYINHQEVAFKAQFSALGQMQSALADMQQNAQSLGQITQSSSNESIKSQLQQFASQYNDWVKRFDAEMQAGGTLADTQAAQVARSELANSIGNRFNGAGQGVDGLNALGFSIDPTTRLATLDGKQLDSVLASNRTGVVNAVQDFSSNFAKSAELLNSNGNFIKNRLDNLSRVVSYIGENKSALQAEFGLGDPAEPPGQIKQAAAAYKLIDGI